MSATVCLVLQELSVGARHIQLWLGSDLVFAGELDKGCGNQVFDYEKTIVVTRDSEALRPAVSGESPDKHGPALTAGTPAMDNVSLFASSDLDAGSAEVDTGSEARTLRDTHTQAGDTDTARDTHTQAGDTHTARDTHTQAGDTARVDRRRQTGTETGQRRGGRSERMHGEWTLHWTVTADMDTSLGSYS